MFRPLSAEETAVVEAVANNEQKPKPVPIVPVPADAPPMQYRHREHGEPSRAWAYHDAGGHVVGYVCRWDFTNSEGKPDKDIRPVCYCELGDGRRAWRSVGMPCPRPLLRLPAQVGLGGRAARGLDGGAAAGVARHGPPVRA